MLTDYDYDLNPPVPPHTYGEYQGEVVGTYNGADCIRLFIPPEDLPEPERNPSCLFHICAVLENVLFGKSLTFNHRAPEGSRIVVQLDCETSDGHPFVASWRRADPRDPTELPTIDTAIPDSRGGHTYDG